MDFPAATLEPVTPTDLVRAVAASREAADAAEVEILRLAVLWAQAHPDTEADRQAARLPRTDDGSLDVHDPEVEAEHHEWFALPALALDAPAAFAVANRMSTTAGRALIRDALVLAHRLPRVWARVLAGEVAAWRARRIAQSVLGAAPDVVAHLDGTVAAVAHKIGTITLDRLVEEALLRLHPEQREMDRLEALAATYARLDTSAGERDGLAELHVRADWKDLHDLDVTLAELAAALVPVLAEDGRSESLDVRRALAVGVLADPARATALLDADAAPAGRPRKKVTLYLHLSHHALAGNSTVGRCETGGERPVLESAVREWCGRRDTHVVVIPVVDLTDTPPSVQAYEIPQRLAERVRLRQGQCVFPYCTRPARACDLDHIAPYASGGATHERNLAPLCRHHHRLKTHAGWRYRRLDETTYEWSSPHGLRFTRDPHGTAAMTWPTPTGSGPRSEPAPPRREAPAGASGRPSAR